MEFGNKQRMWMDNSSHEGFRRKKVQSESGTSYSNNTREAIFPSYYGKAFSNARDARDLSILSKRLEGKEIRGQKETGKPARPLVHYDLQRAFSLVNAGFTPMTIMGKECDKQWAVHTEEALVKANVFTSPAVAAERTWIKRAKAEPVTTVKEFYDILVADRITKDPEIMVHLATKSELEKAGYEVSPLATPIYKGVKKKTKDNDAYYDISACKRRFNRFDVPVYADENIIDPVFRTGNTMDINSMQLNIASTDFAFDSFVKDLRKVCGAKIVSSPYVTQKAFAEQNVLRTIGRRVVNFYRVKFNKRSTLLQDSYTIKYRKEGTMEEQAYAILSEVAYLSIKPFLDNTEKLIKRGKGHNLPSREEFASIRSTLTEFATCMATAEIAKVMLNYPDDANKIEGLAYLKASQILASSPELADNKFLIPLASGYVSAAANRCAAAQGIGLTQYARNTGKYSLPKGSRNFVSALYAKRNYEKAPFNFFKSSEALNDTLTFREIGQNIDDEESVKEGFKALEKLEKHLKEKNDRKKLSQISEEEMSKAVQIFLKKKEKIERSGDISEEEKARLFGKFWKDFEEELELDVHRKQLASMFGDINLDEKKEAPVEESKEETKENITNVVINTTNVEKNVERRKRPWKKWQAVEDKLYEDNYTNAEKTQILKNNLPEGIEQKRFKEDVENLGTSKSLRSGVWKQICSVINDFDSSDLDKDSEKLFKNIRELIPVGELVTHDKLSKAARGKEPENAAIRRLCQLADSEKRHLLNVAASSPKTYEFMTGSQVAQDYYSEQTTVKRIRDDVIDCVTTNPTKDKSQKNLDDFNR